MPNNPTESWDGEEQTWRGHLERLRRGRAFASGPSPSTTRAAVVAISFDSDVETMPLRVSDRMRDRFAKSAYGVAEMRA